MRSEEAHEMEIPSREKLRLLIVWQVSLHVWKHMDVFHKKKKVVTLGSEGGGVPWGGALHQIWLTNCCKLHPDIRPNVSY